MGTVIAAVLLALCMGHASANRSGESLLQTILTDKSPVRLRWDLTPQELLGLTDALIAYCNKNLDALVGSVKNPSWEATLQPAMDNEAVYNLVSGIVTNPSSLSPDKKVRDAANEAEQRLSSWSIEAGMRPDVFAAYKAYASTPQAARLTGEKARALGFSLRDFKRSGLDLPKAKQEQLKALLRNISDVGIAFSNCLDADTTNMSLAPRELAGLPSAFVSGLQPDKTRPGNVIATVKYPDYFPIMQQCKVSATRKKMEAAFNNVCGQENTRRLDQLVHLRHQAAKLLGYPSWAAYAQEVQMAKNPGKVGAFLTALAKKLQPLRNQQLKVLEKFKKLDCAARNLSYDGQVNSWDIAYYEARVEERDFSVDQELLRQYFPMETVTKGMFGIYQEMLGLTFVKDDKLTTLAWAPNVEAFRVNDAKTNELLGVFYMDLYPRDGKYGHAAMFPMQAPAKFPMGSPRLISVGALVTNFPKSTAQQPSLFRHDDVVTYFHEFGHVMHQMVAHTELARHAGTATETDFVEAPSQMLENWCWRPEALKRMSGHYKSGQPLPDALIKKLVASKRANGGISNSRQLALGLFDQRIHTTSKASSADVYRRTMADIGGVAPAAGTFPAARFGHMVGYDAKYYSYMWSQVFSADMFHSRFLKAGVLNPQTGMDYRTQVIGPGGSRDAAASLRQFLGRDPKPDAFLADLGLGAATRSHV